MNPVIRQLIQQIAARANSAKAGGQSNAEQRSLIFHDSHHDHDDTDLRNAFAQVRRGGPS